MVYLASNIFPSTMVLIDRPILNLTGNIFNLQHLNHINNSFLCLYNKRPIPVVIARIESGNNVPKTFFQSMFILQKNDPKKVVCD